MASSFTIPLVTLPVGARQFGPSHPPDAETAVTLSIDRTVPGGLNALPVTSGLAVDVQLSLDGGVTWQGTDSDQPGTVTRWTTVGGLYPNRFGVNAPVSSGAWFLFPGTSRQLRATVTVSGPSSIAVAGTLATQ